jgi:acetyl-CoA C-acetyltransferase
MEMAQATAIIGTGQTRCGKRYDVSYPEMIQEAVMAAIEDAGITPVDIEAVVSGSMPPPMEGVNGPHLYWTDAMAGYLKPGMRSATCGSTGMSIAQTAFYHVASGLFDVVLAVGAEKMYEGEPQGTMSTVADPYFQRPFLAGAPGIVSMQVNEYTSRYNLSDERVREAAASISVRNHLDAFDNPYAHIKVKISIEDVLKSRIISYPVRLLDVCPASDGACAVVFVSERKAKEIAKSSVWVTGVGYCGDEHFFGDSDKIVWLSAIQAAKQAYKLAGIQNPMKELDLAELYIPFSFQELFIYECFGFCDEGKGCELVEKEVVNRNGALPCEPSGGVLSTNPIGATGLQRVAEAAMQIMGKAGDHQVSDVRKALAHAMGGMCQLNGVMILSKDL